MKPLKSRYNRKAAGKGRIKVRNRDEERCSFLVDQVQKLEEISGAISVGKDEHKRDAPATCVFLPNNTVYVIFAPITTVEELCDIASTGVDLDLRNHSGGQKGYYLFNWSLSDLRVEPAKPKRSSRGPQ